MESKLIAPTSGVLYVFQDMELYPPGFKAIISFISFYIKLQYMKFKVVIQKAEEGGYIVSCPALPGCHSQGETIEEALKNIKEAIIGCLESLAEERIKQLKGEVVEVVV